MPTHAMRLHEWATRWYGHYFVSGPPPVHPNRPPDGSLIVIPDVDVPLPRAIFFDPVHDILAGLDFVVRQSKLHRANLQDAVTIFFRFSGGQARLFHSKSSDSMSPELLDLIAPAHKVCA